jgi:hypothetical protein
MACKMVFKLTEGFQGHHKSALSKMFKNPKGKFSMDSMESIENLKTHWQNTFNRHADYDESHEYHHVKSPAEKTR